jgi:hypothetical protein
LTDQSPQRAVAPTKEEEEEETSYNLCFSSFVHFCPIKNNFNIIEINKEKCK